MYPISTCGLLSEKYVRHQDKRLLDRPNWTRSGDLLQTNSDTRCEGRPVLSPSDMLFRTRQPSAPLEAGLAPRGKGGCLLSDSKHAAASTPAPPALGRGQHGLGSETGKLMHGLVSQRAVPSPHREYLGTTYFEGSNADRSSALGLRLNQQNKMKKNKNIPCDINNATRAICKMLRQA